MRIITSQEYINKFNKQGLTLVRAMPEQIGTVLWYDSRDAIGEIEGNDGKLATFSMGRIGHIGVSAPNYVTGSTGKVIRGQTVRFTPVLVQGSLVACDIRDIKE